MISLISAGKARFMGAMQRIDMNVPISPEVSPGIQGMKAYSLLTEQQKGLLKYALNDAAKLYNCKPFELRWAFGKSAMGGPAPLKIWKPKKIEI